MKGEIIDEKILKVVMEIVIIISLLFLYQQLFWLTTHKL